MTEEPTHAERFTDEEAAFRRHAGSENCPPA